MRTFTYIEDGNYVTMTEKEILEENYDEGWCVSKETIIKGFCDYHNAEEIKI